jgi:hypothetical protein
MPVFHPDDIPWIVEELRDLPGQSAIFEDVPDDPSWVAGQFGVYTEAGMFGVVDRAHSAFLLSMPTYPWYANRLEIHELILWVPVRHRQTSSAMRIVREWVGVAKSYNPHSIHAGSSLDIVKEDRVLKLYERAGFKRSSHGVTMRL